MRALLILLFFTQSLLGSIFFVSDRLHFVDADEIGPKTLVRKFLFAPYHASKPVTDKEWHEAIDGKSVAVLVHGYNNEYEEAVRYCSEIVQRAGHLYDVFVCYLWPGGDHALEYLEARGRVMGQLPKRFLAVAEDLTRHADHVDVFAHSMGCRLTLESMQYPSELFFRNVFLMAPAVDDEALEEGERYHDGAENCVAMYILHSSNDKVLGWAYPIGDTDRALGLEGAENGWKLPEHIFEIDCTKFVGSHGSYVTSRPVFQTIETLIGWTEEHLN